VGNLTTRELLGGLGMQLLWIGLGIAAVSIMWRFAIRRFSAVGG
jgi:ABC-2 type transport system permease protein